MPFTATRRRWAAERAAKAERRAKKVLHLPGSMEHLSQDARDQVMLELKALGKFKQEAMRPEPVYEWDGEQKRLRPRTVETATFCECSEFEQAQRLTGRSCAPRPGIACRLAVQEMKALEKAANQRAGRANEHSGGYRENALSLPLPPATWWMRLRYRVGKAWHRLLLFVKH